MLATALATGNVVAGAGAVLFVASDSMIAWDRFVRPFAWAPVAIMVTYHLGQAGLVASLAALSAPRPSAAGAAVRLGTGLGRHGECFSRLESVTERADATLCVWEARESQRKSGDARAPRGRGC